MIAPPHRTPASPRRCDTRAAVYGTKFKIDKKYAPIKALGKGAYGVVCAAKNKETGGKVAIKKITPMCSTNVDGKHVRGARRPMPPRQQHCRSMLDAVEHEAPLL